MDSKGEKIALFRYGVIATLVLEKLPRGELVRRARELADREYDIPFASALGCALPDWGPGGPGAETPRRSWPNARHHAASGATD